MIVLDLPTYFWTLKLAGLKTLKTRSVRSSHFERRYRSMLSGLMERMGRKHDAWPCCPCDQDGTAGEKTPAMTTWKQSSTYTESLQNLLVVLFYFWCARIPGWLFIATLSNNITNGSCLGFAAWRSSLAKIFARQFAQNTLQNLVIAEKTQHKCIHSDQIKATLTRL